VNVDNYGLTLVDLKNLGHKDDPWVLADRVAQVFYVNYAYTDQHIKYVRYDLRAGTVRDLRFLDDLEIRKHIVVSGK
jgi:hypothetical protein